MKIDENVLHRTGRGIGSMGEGITLQIKRKAEAAGALKAYIYLIMDVQLKIQMDHLIQPCTRKMLLMMGHHTSLFIALTGVGKTHIALSSLEREHLNYFDFIIILDPTLTRKKMYH